MIRALLVLMVITALTAQDCDVEIGGLVERPGTIIVNNIGASEVAVIAIAADDVKSYPTLPPGGTASITTNVGGIYRVTVVMTPENAATYRSELTSLRNLVQKQIADATTSAEKTKLFLDLAGIKAAIQALESGGAACAGRIDLDTEKTSSVNATVQWVASGNSGFWDVTCGSNV